MTTLSLWNDKPFLRHFFGQDWEPALTEATFVPPCDIEEKEGFYLLTLDLPGIKKEDIDIQVHEDTLTISGERKSDSQKKESNWTRSERFTGKFQRAFTLGNAVNSKLIEACYEDGVLKVRIPKEKEEKPEVVKIKVGERLGLSDTH